MTRYRLSQVDTFFDILCSSTTNLEEEEIVDAQGNDGNASMPEQVKRPNPWRKMMVVVVVMMMMVMMMMMMMPVPAGRHWDNISD